MPPPVAWRPPEPRPLMDLSVSLSAFVLLFLAEMGDKSQLLVMTLAHRYRAASVIIGSFSAFAFLNLLAVLFIVFGLLALGQVVLNSDGSGWV